MSSRYVVGAHRQVGVGHFHLVGVGIRHMAEAQSRENLLAEQVVHLLNVDANLVFDGMDIDLRLPEIAREEDGTSQLYDFFKAFA